MIQVKSSSDGSVLQMKNEPATPTYDDDVTSPMDAVPIKARHHDLTVLSLALSLISW